VAALPTVGLAAEGCGGETPLRATSVSILLTPVRPVLQPVLQPPGGLCPRAANGGAGRHHVRLVRYRRRPYRDGVIG